MFLTFTIAKIINSIVLLFFSMYYFCGRNGKEYTRQGFGSHNAPYHSPGHSIHAQDIKRKDNRHDATRGRRETYDRFYHGEQGPAGKSAPEASGQPLLDERSELQATTFRLHIFRTERSNFYMRLEDGVLHIACPNETRFEEEEVQSLLKSMLEKALRHEAKRLLPERITLLARQHGFMLTGVKINNSKTHWGSCTMKKSINLSQSLMLLPWHLVDYVLLHELCHTIEMNHSERFWKLMDKVTDNQAIRLRSELKNYHML